MTKIIADHLGRSAFVYIRQSTADQLLHNPEGPASSCAAWLSSATSRRHRAAPGVLVSDTVTKAQMSMSSSPSHATLCWREQDSNHCKGILISRNSSMPYSSASAMCQMAADVVGAETGREAGFGDVGDAYRLGIGHEAEERRDRRIEAGAALRGPLAAGDDLDAPLQGVDDVAPQPSRPPSCRSADRSPHPARTRRRPSSRRRSRPGAS
jgi:hypothetical protein